MVFPVRGISSDSHIVLRLRTGRLCNHGQIRALNHRLTCALEPDALARIGASFKLSMKKYHATLLVIDDDQNDLFFIEKAFRDIGVTDPIHMINGGGEAISYIMGEGKYSARELYAYPTFVMTDLKMPMTTGFDVLQHLKSNPQWAIIPTVVLSASMDLDDINKAYKLGASSYHVKPSSQPELRRLLKTLHDYWMTCEVPEVDRTGRRVETNSKGKLGEKYSEPETKPPGSQQVNAPAGKP